MRIKHSSSIDTAAVFGTFFMAAFAIFAAWRLYQTKSLFFLLLLLRDLIAAYFFLFRKRSVRVGAVGSAIVAYVSTVLPLCYLPAVDPISGPFFLLVNMAFICGFLLATLATIELGYAIGVAPALRGEVCRSGVYRWLKHPMYTGYLIAELPWVFLNYANIPIFALSMVLYFFRIKAENCMTKEKALT